MTRDRQPPPRGSLGRGARVTSGGRSYEKSPVGDRLEYSELRRKSSQTPAAEHNVNYTAATGRSAGKPAHRRASSSGRRRERLFGIRRQKDSREFDAAPSGISVRDVAGRLLPKAGVRIAASGLAAVVVGILAYNIYMSFYVEYKTEIATISEYMETIDVEGVAIRDEIVLEGSLSKNAVKTVHNGDKVSKGEPIINIYKSSQEASAHERIAEIESETAELTGIVTSSENNAATVDTINRLLDNKMVALNSCSLQKSAADAAGLKRDIGYLLNKRMVIMRQVSDYSTRIEKLEAEKEELLKKYTSEPKKVNAEYSGYFSDTCDGYENLLTTSMVGGLTVDRLNEIMTREVTPPAKVIGKLVSSFTWYLACPVPAVESEHLVVGSIYTLYLPYSETESVEAVLERVNKVSGQDKHLAIFRCNSLASELSTFRSQPVKILKYSCEGFVLKKSALHVAVREDSIKNPRPEEEFPRAHMVYLKKVTYPSVYVIVAGQVNEKEVNIIHETDKNVICAPNHEDSSFLGLKDIVVTEERGLYDGKLVR